MKYRRLRHPEYYAIPAYMRLAKKTHDECAKMLGMTVRRYKEKIRGFSDFSAEQGRILAEYLGVTQEQLFLV